MIEHVNFTDLAISPINPRTVIDDSSITALAANLKEMGLIHNLAGLRQDDGKIGIVAGGRRFRALSTLQDDERFQTVPVKVTDNPDIARIWASSENNQREQLNPADEIREYAAYATKGTPVPAIAMAFGVSENHVYRRLKLASLPDIVLNALKSGDITLSVASCFTICDSSKLVAEVLQQAVDCRLSEHHIRQLLKPQSVTDTDRRVKFVGLDAYKEAGGPISCDLFEDDIYVDDVELLDKLVNEKLSAEAERISQEGWNWVRPASDSGVYLYELQNQGYEILVPVCGELTEEQEDRYDELAELAHAESIDEDGAAELANLQAILDGEFTDTQKAVAGAILYVDYDGNLRDRIGLVHPDDKHIAIEAGVINAPKHAADDAPQSGISGALQDDLRAVAAGVRQHAVMNDPDLLTALLAYQLSHELSWKSPFTITTSEFPNAPTTGDNGFALNPALYEQDKPDMYDKDLAKSFRAFRKKGEAHIKRVLTEYLARLYRGGDKQMIDLIDKETKPNIRAIWTPNATNFFNRVKADYLDNLWKDLLDLQPGDEAMRAFGKLKKKQKAEKLEKLFSDADTRTAHAVTAKQAERIDSWLPDELN
ncbi:ParB/RepB/Spo0J family partition protein [Altericroceibacterium spongiae]|uniref:ParB/RepB/Spo0J family partition protein n=1 Tax=Altericroceibacterium spongiae TaxID=2320269 RepID=A0A420EAM0_9SPHN|nr:ParB/RepB/Spo0J family partition protein [Altericroceibacterium spongiae]RKF17738.1 ParB/RepB/Spo0J family partition protein [Altericroceibacterium spongiae]